MTNNKYLSGLGLVQKMMVGLICSTGVLVMPAQAELTALTSQELSSVEGQSTGVLVGLELRINQTNPGGIGVLPAAGGVAMGTATSDPGENLAGTLNCNNSSNLAWCRIGLQFNSNANWLLYKGFNGYINLQGVELYGVDLSNSALFTTNKVMYPSATYSAPGVAGEVTATATSAAAINFTLPSVANAALVTAGTIPAVTTVAIRNLSYTIAIGENPCYAAGNCSPYAAGAASSTANSIQMAQQNQQTYLSQTSSGGTPIPEVYCISSPACGTAANNMVYSASNFDTGREVGILGVQINGNLNIGGQIYAFAK